MSQLTLLDLQNYCKRDPEAYKEEFNLQKQHFYATLEVFRLKPSVNSEEFATLVSFMSHVAPHYKAELKDFPGHLMQLLEEHSNVLQPDLRKTMVSALILLRNRSLLSPIDLLPLFFKLFRCHDKLLREMVFHHIVNDVKGVNKKSKNNKLNGRLQSFMYEMIQDPNPIAAKKSLEVIVELYKKHVWDDAKTVNVISTALTSKHRTLMILAVKFFLGVDEEQGSDSDSDEDIAPMMKDLKNTFAKGAKKTSKRDTRFKKAVASIKRRAKKSDKTPTGNFTAIQMLHDPQGVCEKLYKNLKSSNEKFEVKLMMMNLVSRLIGSHQLIVLNFYPFLQKYIQPHQQHVSHILAYLAQSCHDHIPVETLQPVMMHLVNHFVSDRTRNEVITIGLNTIREMCHRVPLLMTEDLLGDLVQYKNHRDKSIVMAARGLITLYRELNPHLLHKKERGKGADMSVRPKEFGELGAAEDVDGLDLLMAEKEQKALEGEGDEDEDDAWEAAEGDSDSGSGEWMDMPEDGAEVSDSDSDKEEKSVKEEKTEENGEKQASIATTQILTPKDFERMRYLKMEKQMEVVTGKKRKHVDESKTQPGASAPSERVDASMLESAKKKTRMSKEERLASVMEGRVGREKFGGGKAAKEKGGGSTNKDKLKNKPYMMVLKSNRVNSKRKSSLREQAMAMTMARKKGNKKGKKH